MLTHLSLFSGIGGLDLAAEWAGFKTVGQCEWGDYQTKILKKHWPDVPKWRDIHELSADEFYERTKEKNVTVISGGFPCQPHSVSGKRKASDDERDLWPEYIRIVREIKPRWIVGENVPGILSSENGRFFGNVLRELAECGYHAFWYCFPAHAVGAPFWGNRVAIVAASDGLRWDCMEKNKKIRPNGKYLEMLEEWKARQADLLPYMERPDTLPERRHSRNDDGISEGMDRLECLGNAVVPYQFYLFFKEIADVEEGL